MLKKLKWLVLGMAIISIITIMYIVSTVRYARIETTALEGYADSLLTLPDVVSVQSIHRFNGKESYIVASIEHDSGQELYFFVRDGSVQYYFISSELLNESDANVIALDLVQNGEIINTQLGILGEKPIFEVQIEYEDLVYYIVIDAQTREVLMNFYM